MSTTTFSLFFAVLSLAALAGAVVTFALLFVLRGPRWAPWLQEIGHLALPLAWLVATVTTLGSLYYSEVAHFTPCTLCWYQRIAVYPLTLLLGIATFRRDRSVRVYVIAQCAVGAAISLYHSWVQAFPPDGGTSFCTDAAPCTIRYVWQFGFVSLPFMALTAFLAIIALMLAAGRVDRALLEGSEHPDERGEVGSVDAGDDAAADAADAAGVAHAADRSAAAADPGAPARHPEPAVPGSTLSTGPSIPGSPSS